MPGPLSTQRSFASRVARVVRGLPQRVNWRLREVVCLVLSLPVFPCSVRAVAMNLLLGHSICGRMYPMCQVVGLGRLSVGLGAFINTGCLFDLTGNITLGDKVHLAPRVSLYTSTHLLGPPNCRAGRVVQAPIEIHAGSWIGANTVVLPGVTIGAGVVVAAGSVVTADLLEPAVYGGAPARKLRPLDDEIPEEVSEAPFPEEHSSPS